VAAHQQWAEPKELIMLRGSDHFLGIGPATADPVNRSAQIAQAVTAWLGRITGPMHQAANVRLA
jgi:hypothetical protein